MANRADSRSHQRASRPTLNGDLVRFSLRAILLAKSTAGVSVTLRRTSVFACCACARCEHQPQVFKWLGYIARRLELESMTTLLPIEIA